MNILELSKKRYSVRSYLPKEVEKEKLDYLLECARQAPSAVNSQPLKIIVVQQKEHKEMLHQCYERDWFKEAPMYLLFCGDYTQAWKRKFDNKNHCDIDVAIAVQHIVLAVQEIGLGTCWVCNFNPHLCSKLFDLPPHIEPIAILPIGYPKDT